MKALSIRPPWAYMIVYGIPYGVAVKNPDGSSSVKDSGKVVLKNIENRNFPLPKSLELPQRICVHCSTREDPIEEVLEIFHKIGLPYGSAIMMYSKLLPHGAIIGEVTITAQATESKNPWFTGRYGYLLENPVPYRVPIPCRGRLGFWETGVGGQR
jgi:hypothetical protein